MALKPVEEMTSREILEEDIQSTRNQLTENTVTRLANESQIEKLERENEDLRDHDACLYMDLVRMTKQLASLAESEASQ